MTTSHTSAAPCQRAPELEDSFAARASHDSHGRAGPSSAGRPSSAERLSCAGRLSSARRPSSSVGRPMSVWRPGCRPSCALQRTGEPRVMQAAQRRVHLQQRRRRQLCCPLGKLPMTAMMRTMAASASTWRRRRSGWSPRRSWSSPSPWQRWMSLPPWRLPGGSLCQT